ncbi:MAG: VOC family protein [Erythrobacter sp.]|nr:VOC family protein [Erythrobacter sp.]
MELPFGTTQDADFMFTKLIVGDLEQAAAFYGAAFGLVEMHRVEAQIEGRALAEVVYQPTYQGGPLFILGQYLDAEAPAGGEVILGFASGDVDACLARVEAAGGRVVENPANLPAGVPRYAFVRDPEGHLVQVSQRLG